MMEVLFTSFPAFVLGGGLAALIVALARYRKISAEAGVLRVDAEVRMSEVARSFITDLRDEVKRQHDEIVALRAEIEAMRASNAELAAKYAALEQRYAVLEAEHQRLQEDYEVLRRRCDELEAENRRLRA